MSLTSPWSSRGRHTCVIRTAYGSMNLVVTGESLRKLTLQLVESDHPVDAWIVVGGVSPA